MLLPVLSFSFLLWMLSIFIIFSTSMVLPIPPHPCSFLGISFYCLSSRNHFLWFPLNVLAHGRISLDLLNVWVPGLIGLDFLWAPFECLSSCHFFGFPLVFLWMSQLPWSFLWICFEFPLYVSAPRIISLDFLLNFLAPVIISSDFFWMS